jgi:hypothetical protein
MPQLKYAVVCHAINLGAVLTIVYMSLSRSYISAEQNCMIPTPMPSVAVWCDTPGRYCYLERQKVCISLSPTVSNSRSATPSFSATRSASSTSTATATSSATSSATCTATRTRTVTRTTSPSPSFVPTSPYVKSPGLSAGGVAGVVVGVLFVMLAACFGFWHRSQIQRDHRRAARRREKELRKTDKQVVPVPSEVPQGNLIRLTTPHGQIASPSRTLAYHKESTTRSEALPGILDERDEGTRTPPPAPQHDDSNRPPRRLPPLQAARSRAGSLRSVTFSMDNENAGESPRRGSQHAPNSKTPSPLLRPKSVPRMLPTEVEISLGSPLTRTRATSSPNQPSTPRTPKLNSTSGLTEGRRRVGSSPVASSGRKSSMHSVV